MRQITKYMKGLLVAAVGLVALGVSATGSASPTTPAESGGGGGGGGFCVQLDRACEASSGTSTVCVELLHLAVCLAPTGDQFDRACRAFSPSCEVVIGTDLAHTCTCL